VNSSYNRLEEHLIKFNIGYIIIGGENIMYGFGYGGCGCGTPGYGYGGTFVLIVVLFILLIIVGAAWA
jgi:uncharacterized protein (TIGR01732 family)